MSRFCTCHFTIWSVRETHAPDCGVWKAYPPALEEAKADPARFTPSEDGKAIGSAKENQ